MLTRAITGAVFVVVLIGAVLLSEYGLSALFLLATIVGTNEYFSLIENYQETKVPRALGIFLAAAVYIVFVFHSILPFDGLSFWVLLPLITIVFLFELYQQNTRPFQNIAQTIAPVVYIAIPFSLLIKLPMINGAYQMEWVLTYFFLQWSNDTGAYLGGKAFGKRKLFERVSPNKTWEGTISGVALTVLIGLICSWGFGAINYFHVIGMAIIVGVFGSLGDLVQSVLKRSVNVKDSGNIMPGHGGVLDRFDGVLIAMPWVYFWVYLLESIN